MPASEERKAVDARRHEGRRRRVVKVVWVVDVTAEALDELIRPLGARLARWSGEPDELLRLALDDKSTTIKY